MAWIVHIYFGLFSSISTICAVLGTGVPIGCYSSTVKIYNGHQQTTKDGTPCVRWDSVNVRYTKSIHRFPDHTLSDAANYCRAMDKDFLWCWKTSSEWDTCGIKKCDDIDFVTNCGTLKIEQPALLGRNVTFSFTPDSHDPNAILEWQRTVKPYPWYTRPFTYKFTQFYEDGIYYMILTDSKARNDESVYRIHYYNESIQCLMETKTRLILKDNPRNPCGFVYLRNERVVESEDIRLEYYPSETYGSSQYKWVLITNGQYSEITVGDGIYTENERKKRMFELTIHAIKQNLNGKYGVKCGQGVGFTNNITLIVQVPPSLPIFTFMQDIDGCKDCIVRYVMENTNVHCKTRDGTKPINVEVTIGDETFQAAQSDDDSSVFIEFFTIFSDKHHNATITCSVINGALSSPLTTSTKLYVIKSPTVALSVPDEIIEGSSANIISCTVTSSRPAPEVYFDISGTEEIKSTIPESNFNYATSEYSVSVSLKINKRELNRKNISCCRYNTWYKLQRNCSDPKMINLLFPPSSNRLEIKVDPVDPLQMYAVCTLYNLNSACMVNFTSARRIFGSEKSSRNFDLQHALNSEHVRNLNVKKEDNGTTLTCVVICKDFDNLDLRDTATLVLPYRSEIRFNISETTLNISRGEEAHVKCLADSFPASNITWTEELDEGEIIKQRCELKPECVLDINADAISRRQFVCAIHYLKIRDNKTLNVNIYKPIKPKELSDKGNTDGMLIGSITGACLIIVVIGVTLDIIIRKKLSNAKELSKNRKAGKTSDERTYANIENQMYDSTLSGGSKDANQTYETLTKPTFQDASNEVNKTYETLNKSTLSDASNVASEMYETLNNSACAN